MQPPALSLEPLLILSIAFALLGIAPFCALVVWKGRATTRVIATVLAVIACSFYFLRLGEAVGRSKAWYHWRSEYQVPLVDLRLYIEHAHTNGNTQAIDAFCREFTKQNPWAYGREPLFKPGPFRSFVEVLSGSGLAETNAAK